MSDILLLKAVANVVKIKMVTGGKIISKVLTPPAMVANLSIGISFISLALNFGLTPPINNPSMVCNTNRT